MRMTSAGRKGVTTGICLLMAIGGACTPARFLVRPAEEKCPGFVIRPNVPISIVWNQSDTIPLGGSNFIIVPSGALPQNQSRHYRGNPIGDDSTRLAGIEIVPTDGLPATKFERNLQLQLRYVGCPFENKDDEFVVIKTDNAGHKTVLKGNKDTNAKTFTVEIDSFSKFAIAIN